MGFVAVVVPAEAGRGAAHHCVEAEVGQRGMRFDALVRSVCGRVEQLVGDEVPARRLTGSSRCLPAVVVAATFAVELVVAVAAVAGSPVGSDW